MRSKFALVLLTSALAGCVSGMEGPPERGLAAVNVPVVHRTDYVFDAAAPDGSLSTAEAARLNAWFSGMNLGYGDSVYVDGPYSDTARRDVARIAGQYGLLVARGAPVTTGAVTPGMVRVIVSRTGASVPGCPNWDVRSQPNFDNLTMSNFGCGVNSNLAAMVANPQDLVHGSAGEAASDGVTGAKAIKMYRDWPLTAIEPGQTLRPLNQVNTKKDDE
jgi:pilus assembly protein CpaD